MLRPQSSNERALMGLRTLAVAQGALLLWASAVDLRHSMSVAHLDLRDSMTFVVIAFAFSALLAAVGVMLIVIGIHLTANQRVRGLAIVEAVVVGISLFLLIANGGSPFPLVALASTGAAAWLWRRSTARVSRL